MRQRKSNKPKYDNDAECWKSYEALPQLAKLTVRVGDNVLSTEAALHKLNAEAPRILEQMMEKMRKILGPGADKMIQEQIEQMAMMQENLDQLSHAPSDSEQEANVEPIAGGEDEPQCPEGRFEVCYADPDKTGIRDYQKSAFRHLVKNETEVALVIMQTLFESYKNAYSDEHWRNVCDLPDVESSAGLIAIANLQDVTVSREFHQKMAYLQFSFECDWEQEHGMYVVYHPKKPARWATYDGLYELCESDKPVDDEESPPNGELFDAVLSNDQAKID